MSKEREIPNPFDNNLDSYLEEFEPPQEIAIRMYVVICGNGNVVNRTDDDYWYHPSEVTLDIFKEVLSEHCPELDKWQVEESWWEFKRIFKEVDLITEREEGINVDRDNNRIKKRWNEIHIEERRAILNDIIPSLDHKYSHYDYDDLTNFIKDKLNLKSMNLCINNRDYPFELDSELIDKNNEERF